MALRPHLSMRLLLSVCGALAGLFSPGGAANYQVYVFAAARTIWRLANRAYAMWGIFSAPFLLRSIVDASRVFSSLYRY